MTRRSLEYINANLSKDADGLFGYVDSVHAGGVSGWVLDTDHPGQIISIQLFLDDFLLATGYTTEFRPDISRIVGLPVKAGFTIKWLTHNLPEQVRLADEDEIIPAILVVEGDRGLLPLPNVPTFGELRSWLKIENPQKNSYSQKNKLIQSFPGQTTESLASKRIDVRAIAFYLPQFHPIPENDEWWGPGFTEWTNVAQARPTFKGHYQPHVPADLGYYDLRLPEVRQAQADLAKQYGIHGFCYYYYWFDGRPILERPLQEVLASGKPDFPFCLCWANENWSRRWDGSEDDILLKQEHNEKTDALFIEGLIPFFKDSRYITIDNKPLLLVYRLSLLPNPRQTAELWRKICRDRGIGEIYLCAVEAFGYKNPAKDGFDATVQFPPHDIRVKASVNALVEDLPANYSGTLYDYDEVVFNELHRETPKYKKFRGVMCSWDNTARKGNAANVFVNANPKAYELWLRGVVDYTRKNHSGDERLVFVNAWNEWAEGTHLEPCRKFGHEFLQATLRALTATSDWPVLLETVKQQETLTVKELRALIGELEIHLQAQDRSLRYLTRIHRPLLRDMAMRGIFVPRKYTTVAEKEMVAGGNGVLEKIGVVDVIKGFPGWQLDRERCCCFWGWSFAQGHNLHQDSLCFFVLERYGDGLQYLAQTKARWQRDDVKKFAASFSEGETIFAGFRAFLDFAHVEPGEYRFGLAYFGNPVADEAHWVNYFKGSLIIV